MCVWIRSPESLDLKVNVPDADVPDHVGRTKVTLLQRGGAQLPLASIHNLDGTEMLLFIDGQAWPAGHHELTFEYDPDPWDEVREFDHLYDRPVEFMVGTGSATKQSTIEIRL